MTIGGNDSDRESERILERISRETDGGSTLFQRTARRARAHISAADADDGDRVELWGTRIGRVLGPALLAGAVVYFILLWTGA